MGPLMSRRSPSAVAFLASLLASSSLFAQQPLGSVSTADATVTGSLQVTGARAVLVSNVTVTAKDHTAEVTLTRGGSVKVCSTSGLHLTGARSTSNEQPLMVALDRGALEVRMNALTGDLVMTPDLRFTAREPGPLDLQLRVTPNGDTCVENRGDHAPVLHIADQFGESSYELHAGQHVLFEHGSLKEVVDHESSPCGCPAEPPVSVADSGVSTTPENAAAPGTTVANSTADQHPFPAAVSAGLAPGAAVPQAGSVHAQVSTTMSYGGGSDHEPAPPAAAPQTASASPTTSAPASAAAAPASTAPAPETKAQAAPPPQAPPPSDVFHSIGRFFKHLFGGH
jgi:hypothetical protein